MARTGSPRATAHFRGLLKLAENPDFDADAGEDEIPDDDDDADDGDGGDEEYLDNLDDDGMDKGREVRGPRTKLMASMDRLDRGMADLRQATSILAQGLLAVLAKADDEDEDEDKDDDKKDSKEDKARLRKGARTSRINKDDAASSFGEQDDDTPGNRPYDPTNQDEKYTMIQEGPGAGPGPINKGAITLTNAQLQTIVASAVNKALTGTTALQSTAPNPNTAAPASAAAMVGQLNNGGDSVSPFDKDVRSMSFSDLNRARSNLGLGPSLF